MWNRREWFGLGFGAAVPLRAAPRIDRSRIGIITDECAKSPEDAIAFAKRYGIQWLELRGVPGQKVRYEVLPEADLKVAARQFADNGIKISFLNAGLLKHWLPGTEPANPNHRRPDHEEQFRRRLEYLGLALRAARILGVDKVRVFSFNRVADPQTVFAQLVDILGEMVEIAGRERIRLLLENEGSQNVATCAEVAAVLRQIDSPWLGVNWDPLNGVRFKEPPLPDGYAKLPKERIGNVQIKGKSILTGWDDQWLDWKGIFAALERDGYAEQVGLETHIFGENQIPWSHQAIQEILRMVGS